MNDSLQVVCVQCDVINRVPATRLREQPICGKCGQPLFSGHPAELEERNFMRHISRGDLPVLVDFWAPWCGPCRSMTPAYAQAAQQLEPEIRIVKVNTEEARELAERYAIRSIPTLALFMNGREIARQTGAMDARSVVAWARAQVETAAHSA